MNVYMLAAAAALAFLCGGALATPLQDCASSPAVSACLDARLKAANQKLNSTLKSAQERLEQMQARGRRPVTGAFIDSQRKFNAYRDAQCNWQGVRAPTPASSADYVKDCQIRATIAREQELADFLAGDAAGAAPGAQVAEAETRPPPVAEAPPAPAATGTDEPPVVVRQTVPEPAVVAQEQAPAAESVAPAARGNEWRLVKWISGGTERSMVAESNVTIAFDPSGKVAGNASVNRYSGTFRFDVDGRLKWTTAFAVTRMAGPAPFMAQERAFLESLRRTSQYKIDGQQLVLENASSTVVLSFAR